MLLLIGIFLLGMIISVLFGVSKLPVKDVVGIVITPCQTACTYVKNKCSDLSSAVTGYDDLKKQNEKLDSQVTDLKNQLDSMYYLEYENEQLRKLLNFSEEHNSYTYSAATVVSKNTDGWSSQVTINRGSASGISVDDVVITGSGVVGIVSGVGLNWSTVTSIIDPTVSIGAVVTRTREVGITESSVELMQNNELKVSYLNSSSSVNRGDTIQTSGYGGIFPEGLVIGTVSDIIPDPNGLSTYAIINPSVKIEDLRTVYVITDYNREGITK